MRIFRFEEVDSTMTLARALAEEDAPHGTVVLAERQTAGRGRRGRVWDSPAGENLLLSIVLRPTGPVHEAPLLTLGAAAALAEAFDLRVKWPNDLVDADGHKLGGLLAEMETNGGHVRYVLLGLGLNVNQTAFPAELPNATSLARLRGPQDREAVLRTVVDTILARADAPDRLDRWRRYAHTLGRRVRIDGREGLAEALRDDGALIVDGVPVTTGEVS